MSEPEVRVHIELSADETMNERRFGGSVAERIVDAYATCAELRENEHGAVARMFDAAIVEPQRVGQLVGALIDVGCREIRMPDVGERDRARVAAALVSARVDLACVVFE